MISRGHKLDELQYLDELLYAAGNVIDAPFSKAWYERRGKRNLLKQSVYRRIKRLMDIGSCAAILPLVLLILLLCCLAIRLDSPGRIFFFQSRTGKGGRRFKMYKLRTMVKNAEALKEKYSHLNELKPPDFKITNDPRATRVGRILRKTSLDELPQIFNVLKGDMSLVGPRPSSFGAETYSLWQTARFELKPGITGLSQVFGRGKLLHDAKLRYDIAYFRNQSLWLDLQILRQTVVVVLCGRGVT